MMGRINLFPLAAVLALALGGCVVVEDDTGCGDGTCEVGESCSSCPEDCGACTGPGCGDGTCSASESCGSCPEDCGACTTDPPDATITCDQFDIFTQDCAAECAPTWDCELQYESLPDADKWDLDACSDCLVDNLANGVCADCSDPELGIDSCQVFMEDLLGVDCW